MLERGVYYTTFNRPFERVYEAALGDILELDDLIHDIIFDRERRELYNSYVQIFPRGIFARIREHQWDIPEGPSSDEDKDYDDNDNRDNNGNGGEDSKSPDVNRKVGDKRPRSDEDEDDDNRDNNGNGGKDSKSPDVSRKVGD